MAPTTGVRGPVARDARDGPHAEAVPSEIAQAFVEKENIAGVLLNPGPT